MIINANPSAQHTDPRNLLSASGAAKSAVKSAVKDAVKTASALAFCVLLTAGCSTLTPNADDNAINENTAQQSAPRQYHQSIALAGRLSVQYQRNGNDESLHASFTWQQTATHSMVTILSPLGQILATIEINPNGATLIESGQPARSATDVDALAARALGWPLPVAGLRKWLQGFATSDAQRAFVATPHQQTVMTQDGWQIQYPDWQAIEGSNEQRPKRIDLTRATDQAGKVNIRIVLDRWQPQ